MVWKTCAVASICLLAVPAAFAGESVNAMKGWNKITEGVYEKMEVDGSTTRLATGTSGALYDRAVLSDQVQQLSAKVASGTETREDLAALGDAREAIRGIPTNASSTVHPMSSQSGWVCSSVSRFAYAFDSHLAVGNQGATAISRVGFSSSQPGPALNINSIAQYSRANVSPAGSPIVQAVQSSSVISVLPDAVAIWHFGTDATATLGTVSSASCSASTFAYIQLATPSPSCTGTSAYVSLTKSYPTCVTAM